MKPFVLMSIGPRRSRLLVLCTALVACNQAAVHGTAPQKSGGHGVAGSGAGRGGAGAEAGIPLADAGLSAADATAEVPPSPPAACAADVHRAERVPLDLLLLVDTSGSMEEAAGPRSKWSLVHDALVGFARDPKSAGLGLGLQFFPLDQACTAESDCPRPGTGGRGGSPPGPLCVLPHGCLGATSPGPEPVTPMLCWPTPGAEGACPAGTACVPVGRCAISGLTCTSIGQPCASGAADLCETRPRICLGRESCEPADYGKPALAIAALPGAATPIANRLGAVLLGGGTPTGPAVAGALEQARVHQTANPTHRVALVVATDGVPSGCAPGDAAGISALAAAARTASPSIRTYVIGVFTKEEAAMATGLLQQLATAGGTNAPFVLDATADLGQKFRDALDEIRGAAVPCEFTIPAPSGGVIDFGKVNVRYQIGSAPPVELPYVAAVDRCDPMRGGWYYDVAPAQGRPSRVLICPASCGRFKSDPSATVSLAYGCATQTID